MNPTRIAATCARIVTWYATLPDPKPTVFSCADLVKAIGCGPRTLRHALTLLGWDRASVWSRRGSRRVRPVLYAPPGHTVPRPPRGRPRFSLTDCIAITVT